MEDLLGGGQHHQTGATGLRSLLGDAPLKDCMAQAQHHMLALEQLQAPTSDCCVQALFLCLLYNSCTMPRT